jgi:peptide/nickel transport system substrate-binding protein
MSHADRGRLSSKRRVLALLCVLSAAALSACTASSPTSTGGKKIHGGVVTVAESPASPPNYIFPFDSPAFASNENVGSFQQILYRPLYWFGIANSPDINWAQSLAEPPVWTNHGRAVTIRLKHYMWSNGTSLAPQNIAFWMGLDFAEKKNLATYVPGEFPDDVRAVLYNNTADTVTFDLKTSTSQDWFLDDELSQITPLPLAWDRTASAADAGCASESLEQQEHSCPAVYAYLVRQAQETATYATSPLWRVVDGPFKLSSFASNGFYTLIPNKAYSGPVEPTLSEIKFLPFTSWSAEYDALRSGSVTVGYIPSTELPSKSLDESRGINPLSPKYNLELNYYWGYAYLLINFNNPAVGPLFHQLYIRQALQALVDQPLYLQKAESGYGYEEYGPIPKLPPNPYVDAYEQHNPYPFSISHAKALLTEHGWSIPASGSPAFCVRPGTAADECGQGIKQDQKLELNLEWVSAPDVNQELEQYITDASQAGILLNPRTVPLATMLSDATPCTSAQPACRWQIIDYGGVSYPGPYPAGNLTFLAGAGENIGSYSDATMNRLIYATLDSNSATAMSTYENYVAQQIPVIYEPVPPYRFLEVASNLNGFSVSPLESIMPEQWYFTGS